MTKRITIIALLIAFLASESTAQSHQYRRRGAILGGIAGAAIGAAIGNKGNNETAGALIGGAVGAMAGGTIGNQRDQRIEHNLRYHSPHHVHQPRSSYYGDGPTYSAPNYYQPYVYEQTPIRHEPVPVVISPPPANTLLRTVNTIPSDPAKVTKQDVLAMTASGMSDSIIIRQLEILGLDRGLTVAEVIELHQAGVSEQVITAMQLAGPAVGSRITVSNPTESQTTLSREEEVYGPSLLPPPPPRAEAP